LKAFVDPDSFRRSRFASDDALFSAASIGFALALFSFATSFFLLAFSPEDSFATILGAIIIHVGIFLNANADLSTITLVTAYNGIQATATVPTGTNKLIVRGELIMTRVFHYLLYSSRATRLLEHDDDTFYKDAIWMIVILKPK
jgi:hypothetical protein